MKNSIFPNKVRIENNSTIVSYFKKKLYQETVFPKPYFEYYFDSSEQMSLYGIIDNEAQVVFPVTPEQHSEVFINTSNNIPVMDFVHNAFEDMKSYIQQNVYTNKFDINSDINLLDLTIKKSYINATDSYISYFSKYADAFNSFLTNTIIKEINNFDDFIKIFIEFSRTAIYKYPLTRTSFILSHFCNHNISGLVVELIPNGDKNIDEIKYNNFIANPNFTNIIDAAQRYGFMIDKNAPWRLIFDINSSAGLSYMNSVGIRNSKELFAKRYYKTINTDIESLKNVLIGIYNMLVQRKPVEEKIFFNEYCKKFNSEKITKQFVTEESLNERYNENYWIRFYTYIRAKETSQQLSQEQFELIVRKAQQLNAYSGHEKAMRYLSSIFIIPEKKEHTGLDLTSGMISDRMKSQDGDLFGNTTFKF